jgi:hypothetical protein
MAMQIGKVRQGKTDRQVYSRKGRAGQICYYRPGRKLQIG